MYRSLKWTCAHCRRVEQLTGLRWHRRFSRIFNTSRGPFRQLKSHCCAVVYRFTDSLQLPIDRRNDTSSENQCQAIGHASRSSGKFIKSRARPKRAKDRRRETWRKRRERRERSVRSVRDEQADNGWRRAQKWHEERERCERLKSNYSLLIFEKSLRII